MMHWRHVALASSITKDEFEKSVIIENECEKSIIIADDYALQFAAEMYRERIYGCLVSWQLKCKGLGWRALCNTLRAPAYEIAAGNLPLPYDAAISLAASQQRVHNMAAMCIVAKQGWVTAAYMEVFAALKAVVWASIFADNFADLDTMLAQEGQQNSDPSPPDEKYKSQHAFGADSHTSMITLERAVEVFIYPHLIDSLRKWQMLSFADLDVAVQAPVLSRKQSEYSVGDVSTEYSDCDSDNDDSSYSDSD